MSPEILAPENPIPPQLSKRPGGRPRLYGKPMNVPLTAAQRDKADELAAGWRCSRAEAIRRLIDGAEIPAPVERVSVDPAQYDALLSGLNAAKVAINRVGGNLYRLTRDTAQGADMATATVLDQLRTELDAGLADLATLAKAVSGVSPWRR